MRAFVLLSTLVLLAARGGEAHAGEAAPAPTTLTIVATSGMPNHLGDEKVSLPSPHGPVATSRGGAALLADFLRTLAVPRDRLVLVDTGTLARTARPGAIAEVLQAVGYDALVVGPAVAAPGLLAHSPAAPSTAVKLHRAQSTIAVIGGTPTGGLEAFADALNAQARAARRDGASVVIAAVHVGGRCSAASTIGDISHPKYDARMCDEASPLLRLAALLATRLGRTERPQIDALVGGDETATGVTAVVHDIPVAAPTGDGLSAVTLTIPVPSIQLPDSEPVGPHISAPIELCRDADADTNRCDPRQAPARRIVHRLTPDRRIERLVAATVNPVKPDIR